MQTKIKRYTIALAIAPLLLAGCSHSAQQAATPAPGDSSGAAKVGGPQSASAIQSSMDKVNSDPNLSAAQKQIMINQMQHAQAKAAKSN